MPALAPQSRRVFHAPELWLILQALGSVPVGAAVPPEITTDPQAVAAAQARLQAQGLLSTGVQGQLSLAPEVEALVGPAAFPESVLIANITDTAGRGQTARLVCFSWTP